MHRTRLIALAAGCLVAAQAFAQQGTFPDTAENHWAYSALNKLKEDGVLIGYPDSLFRGTRPASRYEIAVAVLAAYHHVDDKFKATQETLAALQKKLTEGSATPADIQSIRAQLNDLKASLPTVGPDVDALKKLSAEFETELRGLGADVKAVRQSLADIGERIKRLEGAKSPVEISGVLTTLFVGGYSQGGDFGITTDGRPVGVLPGNYTASTIGSAPRVGLDKDFHFFNEAALTLKSTDSATEWRFTGVIGNFLSDNSAGLASGLGNQSSTMASVPFREGDSSFYIQHASARTKLAVGKVPVTAEFGRYTHQISPYLFQRPDTTPYLDDPRWDSGAYSLDGASFQIGEQGRGLNFFIGRTGTSNTSSGVSLRPLTAGSPMNAFTLGGTRPVGLVGGSSLVIDRTMGLDFRWPLLKTGEFKAAFLRLDADTPGSISRTDPSMLADRVDVFGLSFRASVLGIPFHGDYTKTNTFNGEDAVALTDNDAVDFGISKEAGILGVKAGYRSIGPNFGAPGAWGRIGMWWNPTNIDEAYVTPSVNLGNWTVNVETHFMKGQGKAPFFRGGALAPPRPMQGDDTSANYSINLQHHLGGGRSVLVGIEQNNWDIKSHTGGGFLDTVGGTPKERWYDFGYAFKKGTTEVSFLYQISDYDSNGLAGFQPFANVSGNTARGGLLTMQVTTRF